MKTRKFFGIFHTYLIQFKHSIATRMYKRKINQIATPKITSNMNKESTQMREGGQAVAQEKERANEKCRKKDDEKNGERINNRIEKRKQEHM